LSSLADDNAVRAVYLGDDGVFAHVEPQTVILEMSTISPGLSALLHQEAAKHGANLIDLPVSGSTPAVEAGTLTLFGGGEQEIFSRCVPIFESIARQWFPMGPATAGIQMKLVVNLLLGINMGSDRRGCVAWRAVGLGSKCSTGCASENDCHCSSVLRKTLEDQD
jgi:3-hydroxyisobutyrate dehydrogenase-like beta-hydroxyacid dehydrogenase